MQARDGMWLPRLPSCIELGKFDGLEDKKEPSRITVWAEPKWTPFREVRRLLPMAYVSLAATGFKPPTF